MKSGIVIRVVKQASQIGYWARVYRDGKLIYVVQSAETYGFDTPKEARAAAVKRLEEDSAPLAQPRADRTKDTTVEQ